jgi:hypothetical protein
MLVGCKRWSVAQTPKNPVDLEVGTRVAMYIGVTAPQLIAMNMLYDSESFVVVHIQSDVPREPSAVAPSDPSKRALTSEGAFASGGLKWEDAAVSADAAAQAMPTLVRHGFEIVDKRSGKEIFLDGSWAEMFQQQVVAWQERTPTQEEVEDTLERYTALAHTPVVVH